MECTGVLVLLCIWINPSLSINPLHGTSPYTWPCSTQFCWTHHCNQQMHSYYILLCYQYSHSELARHVSIPCWDHHQGLLDYKLHSYKLTIKVRIKSMRYIKVKIVGYHCWFLGPLCIGNCLFTGGRLRQYCLSLLLSKVSSPLLPVDVRSKNVSVCRFVNRLKVFAGRFVVDENCSRKLIEKLVLHIVSRTLAYFHFITNTSSASFYSGAGGKSAEAPVFTEWYKRGPSWSGLRSTMQYQELYICWKLQVAHFLVTYCRHFFCHIFVIPDFKPIAFSYFQTSARSSVLKCLCIGKRTLQCTISSNVLPIHN
jgi:hypothetical protein